MTRPYGAWAITILILVRWNRHAHGVAALWWELKEHRGGWKHQPQRQHPMLHVAIPPPSALSAPTGSGGTPLLCTPDDARQSWGHFDLGRDGEVPLAG
jgi:hypothetical protein